MTRDVTLRKWVRQPPASPIIQHLRDEERQRALAHLDGARVLDIASESRVTTDIDAESVTRVDFSPDASEYAREVIGDATERYQTATPETPVLPFDDGAFDAAISIGPYDWKFLAVERLTEELHRVLAPDGRFVFSVPTPRSPYAINGWNSNRYYEPDEALSLVSPDWRLLDVDLLFQYPYYAHMAVNALPEKSQKRFVSFAERASDELTDRNLRNYASYLVLSVEPLQYREYLDSALACLFRPVAENGFWEENDGKIIRALDYDIGDNGETEIEFAWTPDDRELWRYAPFALMGAMEWRASTLAHGKYDDKIERALAYFTEKIETDLREMPSYGIGPLICAFSLAADVFDPAHENVARELFEHSRERFDFTHAEDSLLAYGWSYLAERDSGTEVREALSEALSRMNSRLTPEGLFAFDNHTTRRHQNQMYACWGLTRAIELTGQTGYLENIERVLDYAIDHRMREDGAFIWEDVSLPQRVRRGTTKRLGFRPPHWDFLYECHQTFFVNAVAHYYRAGGERDYDREVARAMSWMYGDSSRGNLVELSELGVPMRFHTVNDRLDIEDQMYKGSYEIGSYCMALTNLLAGPF